MHDGILSFPNAHAFLSINKFHYLSKNVRQLDGSMQEFVYKRLSNYNYHTYEWTVGQHCNWIH